ncbi:MAG: DUF3618 domain-containing protein [Acidimicrobiia bacterium]
MAEVSQELRQDIERIRDDLDTTLDALGERVSPRRIAQRRKAAVRARMTRIRTAVIGSVQESGSAVAGQARQVAGSVQEGAQQVAGRAAEQVREAPEMIQQQAQGNPLAAGLVAFGAGMLLATLFPPTEAEQRAASAVQDRVEPLKDQALEVGREVKEHLQESARESAQQVKETATEATQEVKQQAKSSAEKIKGRADSGNGGRS